MNTFLIIDGNGLLHRAFHALPPFSARDGTPTNAVYGFASMLFNVITQYSPTHIAVCFDTPKETFRNVLFKEYQMQRPKVDEKLISQFKLVREFLDCASIPYFEQDGFEADDLIGTIAGKAVKSDYYALIVSADKDILQLANTHISILSPQKGISKSILYTPEVIQNTLHISPDQIPDFKALAGDPSDNYKGVEGIGPKTAIKILSQYHSVEALYKNINTLPDQKLKQQFIHNKETIMLGKKLATIVTDVPVNFSIEECHFETYNEKVRNFFEKYQLVSLLKKFFPPEKKKAKQLGLF